MRRLLPVSILCGFALGCSHVTPKSPTEENKTAGQVETPTAAVNDRPLDLDSGGSDSKKIDGLTSIHFPYDSSSLKPGERDLLQKDASWIKTHPNVRIQIEGHCDDRGSTEYNFALGEKRAKAVSKYLENLGIPSDRLTVISYGKERPLANGESEEAYAQNRRANFVPIK